MPSSFLHICLQGTDKNVKMSVKVSACTDGQRPQTQGLCITKMNHTERRIPPDVSGYLPI